MATTLAVGVMGVPRIPPAEPRERGEDDASFLQPTMLCAVCRGPDLCDVIAMSLTLVMNTYY